MYFHSDPTLSPQLCPRTRQTERSWWWSLMLGDELMLVQFFWWEQAARLLFLTKDAAFTLTKKFTLLDAICILDKAWAEVTDETVRNCIKKGKVWNDDGMGRATRMLRSTALLLVVSRVTCERNGSTLTARLTHVPSWKMMSSFRRSGMKCGQGKKKRSRKLLPQTKRSLLLLGFWRKPFF